MSISSSKNQVKEKTQYRNLIRFSLLLVPDFFAISLSAITAYGFRFSNKENVEKNLPAIAQFDYRGILIGVVTAWILILALTGTYRPNHANLVVFNLRFIII